MIAVIPMYHPAASLRNGNIMEAEKKDFLQLKEILSKMKEHTPRPAISEEETKAKEAGLI